MDEIFPNQIQLFKSVFKGRKDVFAVWLEKENKGGYLPAYFYAPLYISGVKNKGRHFPELQRQNLFKLTDKEIIKRPKRLITYRLLSFAFR